MSENGDIYFTLGQNLHYNLDTGSLNQEFDRWWAVYEIHAYRGTEKLGYLRISVARREVAEAIDADEEVRRACGASKLTRERRRFWLDKPHVDQVRVEETRKGIATRMYAEAVRHFGCIYASTIQTKEARALWASFPYKRLNTGRKYIGDRRQFCGNPGAC